MTTIFSITLDPQNFVFKSQDFYSYTLIHHLYQVSLASTCSTQLEALCLQNWLNFSCHIDSLPSFPEAGRQSGWEASSWSLRIIPAPEFNLIALVLFSEGRRRSKLGFRHQSTVCLRCFIFSVAGKKGRDLPSVRLRENTTTVFVANQSMAVYWYEIGLRCLVDLSDCCYCQPHPNTVFIFIFFPPPLNIQS